MRILVTNDDGAHAPGLWALVRALQPLGEVVVSAPDRDRSGVGPALSVNDMIRAKEVVPVVAGVKTFSVEGTPGDAAVLGLKKLVGGTVDVVASGINPGSNVGEDVIISGTIGAGVHAYLNGLPTVAVSVAGETDPADSRIAAVTRSVVEDLGRYGAFPIFVNLNFPDLTNDGIQGVRRTSVAARFMKDDVEAVQRGYRTFYWLLRRGGRTVDSVTRESDVWATRNGYVSISSVYSEFAHGVVVPRLDALVESARKALVDHT